MTLLNDEQMNKCSGYEQIFRWALNSNFVGAKSSEFQALMNVYEEVFGEKLNSRQMGCNTCRLNALKKLGEAYNKTKEYNEQAAKRLDKKEDEPQTVTGKKKAGRPKKLDI